MGLAASQVRLLSLTNRQHTIELRAQYLQAQKLRLANDSDSAYEKYINALDATQIQTKLCDSNYKTKWMDASLNNIMRYDYMANYGGNTYFVQDITSGKLYAQTDIYNAYYSSSNDITNYFEYLGLSYELNVHTDEYNDALAKVNEDIENGWNHLPTDYTQEEYEHHNIFLEDLSALQATDQSTYTYFPDGQAIGENYETIFYAIQAAGGCLGLSDENAKSSSWVTNMVKNGAVILAQYNKDDNDLENVSTSSNTSLREITNESDIERADSEYETTLTEIDDKEKKYNIELNKLEAERSAIKTEQDSLKQVADDNISNTFQLFS